MPDRKTLSSSVRLVELEKFAVTCAGPSECSFLGRNNRFAFFLQQSARPIVHPRSHHHVPQPDRAPGIARQQHYIRQFNAVVQIRKIEERKLKSFEGSNNGSELFKG